MDTGNEITERSGASAQIARRANGHTQRLYVVGRRVGPVKIGISADPRVRLLELQCGNPSKLRILVEASGSRELEFIVHRFLLPWQIHSEWFQRKSFVATFIECLQEQLSVPRAIDHLATLRDGRWPDHALLTWWARSKRPFYMAEEKPCAGTCPELRGQVGAKPCA